MEFDGTRVFIRTDGRGLDLGVKILWTAFDGFEPFDEHANSVDLSLQRDGVDVAFGPSPYFVPVNSATGEVIEIVDALRFTTPVDED